MQTTYGLKTHHWGWLVSAYAVAFTGGMVLTLLPFFLGESPLFWPLAIALVVISYLIPTIIEIWWTISFSRSAAKVIGNRVPTIWSVFLLAMPFTQAFILQYYFNRYATKTLPKKPVGPSTKFKILALIIIIPGIIWNGWLIVNMPNDLETLRKEAIAMRDEFNKGFEKGFDKSFKIQSLQEKASTLEQSYHSCRDRIDYNYGKIPEDKVDAEYEKCEQIRIEQNKAVDEYEESLKY